MKKQTCENCKYFRWEDSVWGYCKRYPRQIIYKSGLYGEFVNKYPRTAYDDYCGEYKKRIKKK